MKLLTEGAEAKIYVKNNAIIKVRTSKKYRIKELDEALRKQRTKKEVKILEKISSLGFTPLVSETDESETIEMTKISGKKLAEALEQLNYKKICKEIGEKIKQLHDHEIIHGDLTTSNMIYDDKQGKLYIIDFGLSMISAKDEDKAVDLHLLKEALTSKHYAIAEQGFKKVLKGYNDKSIEKRLHLVEKRGRNKQSS